MADVKWIKVCTDIFDDEKMLLIESMPEADGIIVCWFKLLCLAGKQNNSGVFMLNDKIAYTDEMLATIFRRPLNTVRLALDVFTRFGMIEIIEDAITIPNWEKHQSVDRLNELREYNRLAQRKSREKRKLLAVNDKSMTSQSSQGIDKNRKDIEEDKEKESIKEKKTASRFRPPTVEEVQAYCAERFNNVDAQRFVNYYESNGWKVGKNPMKDWKAAVRTWERSEGKPAQKQKSDGSEYADLT